MLFSWVFIATDPRLFTLLALSSEGSLEGRASLSAATAEREARPSRLPSELRASRVNRRGSVAINTQENSMEVYRVSITFWLAFEWICNPLKDLQVTG